MPQPDLPPIPKMYLAQIEGRCSLQYIAENEDRKTWLKEWVDPKQDGKPYTRENNINGSIHCFEIKFPGRVFSNSGRDSILRPVMGKNGIPYIPGSSVKGLFRRVCNRQQKIDYCGDSDHPGKLRFHGAYPKGDWTKLHRVQVEKNGQRITENRYLIEDLVHPQQNRQVQGENQTTAIALISFYQPTLIFEFSSADPETNWQEVEKLLHQALSKGLGGKTSNGYGFASSPDWTQKGSELYNQSLHISLTGTGVSSKLLSGEPEFRPHIFKAAIRGHASRLLAGVCHSQARIETEIDLLFGSTNAPGEVEIFWNQSRFTKDDRGKREKNPTYKVDGVLHVLSLENQKFINSVVQFAYIMGGFGKTWRRISHKDFYPEYVKQERKFDIGCHWDSPDAINGLNVQTTEGLNNFLTQLHSDSLEYLRLNLAQSLNNWREAWHPNRVAVYSQVVEKSQAVSLFHQESGHPFKTTLAISGRQVEDSPPTTVSSVWHRMLPLPNNQYLEIVTVFHGDRTPWNNQLKPFIQEIKTKLKITNPTWGNKPEL